MRSALVLCVLLLALSCAGSTDRPRTTPEAIEVEPPALEGVPREADPSLGASTEDLRHRNMEPGLDLPETELGTQRIFRIRYDGPEGEGRLRLVLRLERSERYTITTADVLGRALWSLSLIDGELVLVDHRAESFCRSAGEVLLPEVALAPLPLASIPGVLLGYLPVPPGAEIQVDDEASIEILEPSARRWTARREGERLESWTLWLGEVPTLWWISGQDGGILSHRRGVQFRWRQVVRENLDGELRALVPPDGYLEVICHEPSLPEPREDQPAPGSAGPSP